MAVQEKKLRERAVVEAFLRSKGHPISALLEWDRERPDAIVRIDDSMVGIDVTQVVEVAPRQPMPPQMWTSEANRAMRYAQKAFEKNMRLLSW